MIKAIQAIVVSFLLFSEVAHATPCTREQFLTGVEEVSASFIEPTIPDTPLGKWLAALPGMGTDSSTEAGSCDDPMINPFAQNSRDIPVCVGIQRNLKSSPQKWVRIVIRMGSTQSCTHYTPSLLAAHLAQAKDKNAKGEVITKFGTLEELAAYMTAKK